MGQKFRHLVKFSSLFSENMLNSIVLGKLFGQNYSSDKTFRRTKISSPSQNFVSFVRQSYADTVISKYIVVSFMQSDVIV